MKKCFNQTEKNVFVFLPCSGGIIDYLRLKLPFFVCLYRIGLVMVHIKQSKQNLYKNKTNRKLNLYKDTSDIGQLIINGNVENQVKKKKITVQKDHI